MPSPTEITPAQLARQIGTPDCPVLIDVRLDDDYALDPHMVPGALRCAHDDLEKMLTQAEAGRAVVYCQKGFKISQGAAALLRSRGVAAETLLGGQWAWRDAGLPMVDGQAFVRHVGEGESLWVTRHRPKVDRVACPWLIRRFIDPRARFLFVEPSQVLNVAERFGATALDVDGATFAHGDHDVDGDGKCTFDALLSGFGLTMPALETMARIVRSADTGLKDGVPEAAGLLAVLLGLSRQYRDDLQQLEAAMPVFDALFRWARDAQGETHTWPDHHGTSHGR